MVEKQTAVQSHANSGHCSVNSDETKLGALARALTIKLGVKILSPEFEILLTLYDHGGLSAGDLQIKSTVSSTAFYARLKMLADGRHIRLDKSMEDRRVSVYALTAETKRLLDEALSILEGWVRAKATTADARAASFDWYLARMSNRLDLNLLSPEFGIIMNIYDSEPISTSELFYKSRLANSRFYAALALLMARRTIRSLINPNDRRRRLYCLPRRVRAQLDQLLRDFRVTRPQLPPNDPEKAIALVLAAAREAAGDLTQAIDSIAAPVYVTDERGVLTHFNSACATFAGRMPVAGQDRWCVTWRLYTQSGEPLPHSECPMAEAIKTNRPVRGAVAIAERPDNTRALFTPYPSPITSEAGVLVGAVNMLIDITDRRAFVLPYRCDCGASGNIRWAHYDDPDEEPRSIIVQVEGPFRVVGKSGVSCLRCGKSEESSS